MVTLAPLEIMPMEFASTWDDSYKQLPWIRVPYGDLTQLARWQQAGFTHTNFTGMMCSDQKLIPKWARDIGVTLGWYDCGYTFYKMTTGDILPPHKDHFSKYKKLFNIKSREDVMRCVVYLDDKKTGHMSEFAGESINDWYKGGAVAWRGTVEHSALNIGNEPRYTLQITGHS